MIWHLVSVEERHAAFPETFDIHPRTERETVLPGQFVKIIFECDGFSERMWVVVTRRDDDGYCGSLRNTPHEGLGLDWGDLIQFGPEHIAQVAPIGFF